MRVRPTARRAGGNRAAGLLLCTALLWVSSGLGESRLVVPRLPGGLETRLILTNPTGADAQVTLSAYGFQGELLPGLENPLQLILPRHRQLALTAGDLFGPGVWPETAWVEALSPAEDLVGSVLYLDGAVTFLDGNDLPGVQRNLLFDQVRLGGGERTEIHLINPSDRPASVQLQLQEPRSAPYPGTLEIPARGASRLALEEFFGIEALAPGSYLRATAEIPLAGFALIRTPQGDGFGLNARNGEDHLTDCGLWIQPRCSYSLPQLTVLGPWHSELGLVNSWHLPAIVILSAFASDGRLYDETQAARNPVTLQLEPGESFLEATADLFGFHGTQLLDGYIQVDSTSPALAGYLNYGLPANGSRSSLAATARPRSRALFSGSFTPEALFTGVALLNPGSLASNVRILEMDSAGGVLESFQTVLQPGQRLARMMESVAVPDSGMIWVRSDLPLYMTSILAGVSVLANLAPQTVPETYVPDEGLSPLGMKPPLAVVQPGGTQKFYLSGDPLQVTWKVNGIPGGNETVGTVDERGVFTAPARIPSPRVVTVTAQGEGRTTGASVDVLGKETLFTSNRILQSVTYLESNQALYTAELTLLASSSSGMRSMAYSSAAPWTTARAATSQIFETRADRGKIVIADFNNEVISKIIPYPAASGGEYLLLAAQTTGRILRLDPATRQVTQIFSGLEEPTALVVDPRSGDLLVAERSQITIIERSLVEPEPASAPSEITRDVSASASRTVVGTPAAGGMAVDTCTGNLYFSDSARGLIYEFSRRSQELREVGSGFQEPGQLLAVYRAGVACPDSFQLLVSDRDSNQVTVLVPRMGFSAAWYTVEGNTDLAFLTRGNPFASSHEAVVLTELNDSGQVVLSSDRTYSLAVVEVPDLYRDEPVNLTRELSAAEADPAGGTRAETSAPGAAPVWDDEDDEDDEEDRPVKESESFRNDGERSRWGEGSRWKDSGEKQGEDSGDRDRKLADSEWIPGTRPEDSSPSEPPRNPQREDRESLRNDGDGSRDRRWNSGSSEPPRNPDGESRKDRDSEDDSRAATPAQQRDWENRREEQRNPERQQRR